MLDDLESKVIKTCVYSGEKMQEKKKYYKNLSTTAYESPVPVNTQTLGAWTEPCVVFAQFSSRFTHNSEKNNIRVTYLHDISSLILAMKYSIIVFLFNVMSGVLATKTFFFLSFLFFKQGFSV